MTKTVQPLEAGVVSAIRVSDGDHVVAGQPLVEVDPTQAGADRDHYRLDLVQAQLDVARLRGLERSFDGVTPVALVNPPPNALADDVMLAEIKQRSQYASQQAKLRALDAQMIEKQGEAEESAASIARVQATLPWQSAEADIRRSAREQQVGSTLAYVQAERSLIDQQQEVPVLSRHREQSVARIQALQQQRAQQVAEYEDSVLGDLAKARMQASELSANLAKADQRVRLDVLRSPINGTVESLAVHTIGGVVTPAQPLLMVVPDDGQLIVEASVDNKDVGFIRPGQRAEVKVETFAFTRYGMLDGAVVALSRDAVFTTNGSARDPNRKGQSGDQLGQEAAGQSYLARVSLKRDWIDTEAGRMAIGPGMAVTADIYTGRRSIISFLLSPLQRMTGESMHER